MAEQTSGKSSVREKSLPARLMRALGLQPKKPTQKNAKGWRLETTKISQGLDQVTKVLRADNVRRLLVQGDRAFFGQVKAALPDLSLQWSSSSYHDVMDGALNPEGVDYAAIDAIICGGGDAVTCYRHAVARLADFDGSKPVHWVADNWEFCAGTLPTPSGITGGEIIVFNHFQHFFGVKDPLQFRIETLQGEARKYFYRILQPNESLLLHLSDLAGDMDRPICVLVHVSHPMLTRGRHFRYRVCADLHWRDSFTTLHGAHEFLTSPDYHFEFRLAHGSFRAGEVALTVPNYGLDMGDDREIRITADGEPRRTAVRNSGIYLEEVKTPTCGLDGNRSIGWTYRGYGGSFWFALEDEGNLIGGHRGCILGNHHQSVPILDRHQTPPDDAELDWYRRMAQSGFIVRPHALPLVDAAAPFRFGFEWDGANPPVNRFHVHYFDGAGSPIGDAPYRKTRPGPAFGEDLLAAWGDPAGSAAKLAIIAPDWIGGRLRHKGMKKMANLFVEMRGTKDRDATEFQDCWRNCGVVVEGLPHFANPSAAVFGRSNLFGRVRCDPGYRTAVVAIHGAGWLGHRGTAHLEIMVRDLEGSPIVASADIPAFCWRVLWLDELFPDLMKHLAPDHFGALLVQCHDADLNCQLLTVSDQGAVGLQHLWGY